mgnify:CR=1 FL=1|jgi:ABC-2 type transport system permease protein
MDAWKQFPQMFMAHLKMTFREKSVWFWNIFFPVILMSLFMIIFGGGLNDELKAKVAVAEPQSNAVSTLLLEQLRQLPMLEFAEGQPVAMDKGQELVKDKKVDALIVLPASETDHSLGLVVNREDERSGTTQALVAVMNQFVQSANLAAAGVSPMYSLEFSTVSAGRDDLEYQDFLMTGMIALSVAQAGLFGMVAFVEMRRKGVLKRLRMTPASSEMFGIADIAVRFVLGVIQIVLLTTIGVFGFDAHLHLNAASLAIAYVVGALTFNAMGYLFSAVSKSMEAYMAYANIASFVMMFLSGVFLPVETLPDWLQPVSRVLPLTYFVDGMRDGLVYASGVTDPAFWMAVGIMAAWGAVSFVVGARLYRAKSIAATR